MSNLQKLIEKLKRNPTEARYKDVKKVLEAYGFRLENVKGSHHKFKKGNYPPIQIVVHQKKVKKYYIKDALNTIFTHHEKK